MNDLLDRSLEEVAVIVGTGLGGLLIGYGLGLDAMVMDGFAIGAGSAVILMVAILVFLERKTNAEGQL